MVVQVFLPLSDIQLNGVAHIPLSLKQPFVAGSPAHQWLLTASEHTRLGHDDPQPEPLQKQRLAFYRAIRKQVPGVMFHREVLRVERSKIFNQWHYDGAWPDPQTRFRYDTIPDSQRNPEGAQHQGLVTLPFPTEIEKPTVAQPWGGEYKGADVQGPMGCATILFSGVIWHRGDRSPAEPQGLLFCAVSWRTQCKGSSKR